MRKYWAVPIIFGILLLGPVVNQDAFSALFVDSFLVPEDTSPQGLAFSTDGTKMFVIGNIDDGIEEYDCTAFDVSTCVVVAGGPFGAGDGEPSDLAFNPAGTKMFVMGNGADRVVEFDCTAFDVSTCINAASNFGIGGQETAATGLAFNPAGTKMFVVGDIGDDVNEYDCTAFDVSTCVFSGNAERFDFSAQEANARGIAFSNGGGKMFILGTEGDDVGEYHCATGYDVSTCVYAGDTERFDVSAQDLNPTGLAFSADGLKLFVVADPAADDSVFEYQLGTAYDVTSIPVPIPTEGGSASKHKTRPTFGLDHNTFLPVIEGGFSFNRVPHDITDNFWTPFEEQEVKVGQTNSFSAKVFADQKLRVQEFLFGIPQVGDAHMAELGIEIFYDTNGDIERVQVVQKTDIIDIDSLKVVRSKSKCLSDDTIPKCITTLLSMKFLEPLKDKIMAIKAIDFKGRSQFTYLNEGFDISGNSLNPMQAKMIPGTEKYEGLVEVTQIAKYSDIWVAKDGREFEMNEVGSFKQINQSFERYIDTGLLHRSHSEFAAYKQEQIILAEQKLMELLGTDSIQNDMPGYTTILWDDYNKRESPEFFAALEHEKIRIAEMINQIYDPRELWYPIEILDEIAEINDMTRNELDENNDGSIQLQTMKDEQIMKALKLFESYYHQNIPSQDDEGFSATVQKIDDSTQDAKKTEEDQAKKILEQYYRIK